MTPITKTRARTAGRRRTTLTSLLLGAALLLSACADKGAGGTGQAGDGPSVVLVTPEKAGDGGPTDQMLAGLRRAEQEFGLRTRHIEATDGSTYESTLRNLGSTGASVVIVAFTQFTEAIAAVAPEFPDTRFIHLYADPAQKPAGNVLTVTYDTGGPAYLAGVLAAKTSATGKVGFVGGQASPQVSADYHAFVAGVTATDPNAKVQGAVVGSWSDPVKGQQVAQTLYGAGVDTILAYGGGSSAGVVKAAQQKGALVALDGIATAENADVVAATATQEFGTTIYQQLKAVHDNAWKAGHATAGLDNDGTSLAPVDLFSGKAKPDQVAKVQSAFDAVRTAKSAIIAGSVKVPFDTTGF
ncbi:MAG: BMP family ABC transporter substrate-binding protein [Kibdelosporangium sp.]